MSLRYEVAPHSEWFRVASVAPLAPAHSESARYRQLAARSRAVALAPRPLQPKHLPMTRALLAAVPVAHAAAPTARAATPVAVARAAAPRAARAQLRANGCGWAKPVRTDAKPVRVRATRAVSTAASAGAIAWPPSVDQSVCMDVPMDLYALLGGTKASLPDADAVLQAMVARLTKDDDDESGFTLAAVATRTLLVEQAAACLSNQESRKAYDASLVRNPKASTPVRRPVTLCSHPPSPRRPRPGPRRSRPPTTVHGVFDPRGPPASTDAGPYPPIAREGGPAVDWPTRLPSPIRHARARWMSGYSHPARPP